MMIRKIKQIWIIKMNNKIEKMVRLYYKDFEAVDEGNTFSSRPLTFEEIQKNRRTAKERLLTLPKEQLVDYILGKNNLNL